MPGAQIGEGRARKPHGIDAEMAVKAPVLGRDHRIGQVFRQVLEAQRLAEQIAIGGDQRAVLGEERDARLALRRPEIARVGQGERANAEHAEPGDEAPQRGPDQKMPRAPALGAGWLRWLTRRTPRRARRTIAGRAGAMSRHELYNPALDAAACLAPGLKEVL